MTNCDIIFYYFIYLLCSNKSSVYENEKKITVICTVPALKFTKLSNNYYIIQILTALLIIPVVTVVTAIRFTLSAPENTSIILSIRHFDDGWLSSLMRTNSYQQSVNLLESKLNVTSSPLH